ncbi:hypothetical protein WP8W18C01_45820 [Pseudomonas putida]|uniref:Uncharacterized protein n=1 Tax=Pseudomonas putida TaxID=303 RepID=A0A6S5TFQ5_PSEPU|nr:hypothetical protein WP8W18C01_45820 [Pseudomonas putida]
MPLFLLDIAIEDMQLRNAYGVGLRAFDYLAFAFLNTLDAKGGESTL